MNANEQRTQNLADNDDDMDIPEFTFEGALPNPFAEQYRKGVSVTVFKADGTKEHHVRLDPDVAERFPTPEMVNTVLRSVMREEERQAAHLANHAA